MWSLLAFLVVLVFIIFVPGRRYYQSHFNKSKYGKFTPKKKR